MPRLGVYRYFFDVYATWLELFESEKPGGNDDEHLPPLWEQLA